MTKDNNQTMKLKPTLGNPTSKTFQHISQQHKPKSKPTNTQNNTSPTTWNTPFNTHAPAKENDKNANFTDKLEINDKIPHYTTINSQKQKQTKLPTPQKNRIF